MDGDWNRFARCCGNCAFWALADKVPNRGNPALPRGQRGYDGDTSDCRINAPVRSAGADGDRYGRKALWPETGRTAWCGEFVHRSLGPHDAKG